MSEASITHAEGEIIMFVILTYDVNVKRVAKVRKTCIRYLTWVQNSVFECLLDEAKYVMVKAELQSIIDEKSDSLRFYRLGNQYRNRTEHFGNKPDFSQDDVLLL